jgi:hypothetical protein
LKKTLQEDGVHITEYAAGKLARAITKAVQGNAETDSEEEESGAETRKEPEPSRKAPEADVTESEIEINTDVARYIIKRRRAGLDELEQEHNIRITLKTEEKDPKCLLAAKGKKRNVDEAIVHIKRLERDAAKYARRKEQEEGAGSTQGATASSEKTAETCTVTPHRGVTTSPHPLRDTPSTRM